MKRFDQLLLILILLVIKDRDDFLDWTIVLEIWMVRTRADVSSRPKYKTIWLLINLSIALLLGELLTKFNETLLFSYFSISPYSCTFIFLLHEFGILG